MMRIRSPRSLQYSVLLSIAFLMFAFTTGCKDKKPDAPDTSADKAQVEAQIAGYVEQIEAEPGVAWQGRPTSEMSDVWASFGRFAPENPLLFVAMTGLPEADAESSNRLQQLLADEQVKRFTGMIRMVFDKSLTDKEQGVHGPTIRRLMSGPWAFYVDDYDIQSGLVNAGGVMMLGERADEIREALPEALARFFPQTLRTEEVDNAVLYSLRSADSQIGQPISIEQRDDILLLGIGHSFGGDEKQSDVGEVVDVGTPPAWFESLQVDSGVDSPLLAQYYNMAKWYENAGKDLRWGYGVVEMIQAIEPDRKVQSVSITSGLGRQAMETRVRLDLDQDIETPLLDAVLGLPVRPVDIAMVPEDAVFAASLRMDTAKWFEGFIAAVRQGPEGKHVEQIKQQLDESWQQMAEELGLASLDKSVLSGTATVWATARRDEDKPAMPLQWNAVALFTPDDYESFKVVYDRLVMRLQVEGMNARHFDVLSEPIGDSTGFRYIGSGQVVSPCWVLSDKQLIISIKSDAIRDVIEGGDSTLLANAAVRESLSSYPEPAFVGYIDTARLFDEMYPTIQSGYMMLKMMAQGQQQQGNLPKGTPPIDFTNFDLVIGAMPSKEAVSPHLAPVVWTLGRSMLTEGQSKAVELRVKYPVPVYPLVMPGILHSINTSLKQIAPNGVAAPNAQFMQSSGDKLKRLILAVHQYHDTHKQFPPAFVNNPEDCNTVIPNASPLYSWRVLLLPYLGEKELYDQFHLDESWDSPHNKTLIEKMPDVYRRPDSNAAPGMTTYQSIRFSGEIGSAKNVYSAMPGIAGQRITYGSILDGTSNTVLFVETADEKAVEWTRPDDYTPDSDSPIEGLLVRDDHLLMGMCDGSLAWVPGNFKQVFWMPLFGTNDGGFIERLSMPPHEVLKKQQTFKRSDHSKAPEGQKLKKLVEAIHRFHDTYRRLPMLVTGDSDRTPLLSWRVALLPYLGEKGLYDQFHLDEPWDSPHNKTLIEKMPDVFKCPDSNADNGMTPYQAVHFVGDYNGRICKSMLPGLSDKKSWFGDVTDGLVNTVLFVETDDEHAIEWTRPDDYQVDPDHPIEGLLVRNPKDQYVTLAFADGSIRKIRLTVPEYVWMRMFLRNDGHVILEPEGPDRGQYQNNLGEYEVMSN